MAVFVETAQVLGLAFGDRPAPEILSSSAESLDFLAVRKIFHTFDLGNGARTQYDTTRNGVANVARRGRTTRVTN